MDLVSSILVYGTLFLIVYWTYRGLSRLFNTRGYRNRQRRKYWNDHHNC